MCLCGVVVRLWQVLYLHQVSFGSLLFTDGELQLQLVVEAVCEGT
jgi:hypothetical protein